MLGFLLRETEVPEHISRGRRNLPERDACRHRLVTIIDYVAADLNEDGNLDLIGKGANSPVYVPLGNGNGSFQAPVAYDAGANCDHCVVQAADFDADGHLDLATGIAGWRHAVSLGRVHFTRPW